MYLPLQLFFNCQPSLNFLESWNWKTVLQFGGLIEYFIRKCYWKNIEKVCVGNFRISYWRWGRECVSYFLMRPLFLRATNLLLFLLLFNKTMSLSLAILFSVTLYYMTCRALSSSPYPKYLAEFWIWFVR